MPDSIPESSHIPGTIYYQSARNRIERVDPDTGAIQLLVQIHEPYAQISKAELSADRSGIVCEFWWERKPTVRYYEFQDDCAEARLVRQLDGTFEGWTRGEGVGIRNGTDLIEWDPATSRTAVLERGEKEALFRSGRFNRSTYAETPRSDEIEERYLSRNSLRGYRAGVTLSPDGQTIAYTDWGFLAPAYIGYPFEWLLQGGDPQSIRLDVEDGTSDHSTVTNGESKAGAGGGIMWEPPFLYANPAFYLLLPVGFVLSAPKAVMMPFRYDRVQFVDLAGGEVRTVRKPPLRYLKMTPLTILMMGNEERPSAWAWSGDSARLALLYRSDDSGLIPKRRKLVIVGGGIDTCRTLDGKDPWGQSDLAWSHDGEWIAVSAWERGKGLIDVYSVDGTARARVAEFPIDPREFREGRVVLLGWMP